MKINWSVRLKNRDFWLSIIPVVCLLAQQVLGLLGVDWEFGALNEQMTAIVGTVFAVLALLGVVADPTTPGISDSSRAMHYISPGIAETKGETDSVLKSEALSGAVAKEDRQHSAE